MSGFERLALANLEQMKFCRMEGGRICWNYLGNRLMPIPNINRATLLKLDNLSFMIGDDKLVHPSPSQPYIGGSSSSQPSFFQGYTDIHNTLWSIQEEEVF